VAETGRCTQTSASSQHCCEFTHSNTPSLFANGFLLSDEGTPYPFVSIPVMLVSMEVANQLNQTDVQYWVEVEMDTSTNTVTKKKYQWYFLLKQFRKMSKF
jgi:hypothetical protein